MSRQPRCNYPDTKHHVTSRGNNGEQVFRSEYDKLAFLRILADSKTRFDWEIHAYCLMDNHFHLLLETRDANISKGMQFLIGTYTQKHNHVHGRKGHLFQGRFWSNPIEDTQHFLEVARYIALNPVRANLIFSPEMFHWSSCPETAGFREEPTFLNTRPLLSIFSDILESARIMYLQFIYQGIGKDDPGRCVETHIQRATDADRIRWAHIHSIETERPSLAEVFRGVDSRRERDLRIRKAYLDLGYSVSEISSSIGMSRSAVSMMLKRYREKVTKK